MSVPTQPVVGPGTDDAGAYVRAVRLWLDDLPSEDADELTLGMEADLAERAAESGERLWPLLGEPEAYAAELRSAAGLPPRRPPDEPARPGHLAQFRADWQRLRDSVLERWPWVRDLRAAWWLARGFTLLWVLGAMAGSTRPVAAALVGAVLSFLVGRWSVGRTQGPWPGMILVANLAAAVAVVPVLVVALGTPTEYVESEAWSPSGMTRAGEEVSNLFVYDAQGQRVQRARVFDQTGQEMYVDRSWFDMAGDEVPVRPDGSLPFATDVFPLEIGEADPWGPTSGEWTPPLTLAPLPVRPPDDASPGASATPSAPPTTERTPTPTVTPSD